VVFLVLHGTDEALHVVVLDVVVVGHPAAAAEGEQVVVLDVVAVGHTAVKDGSQVDVLVVRQTAVKEGSQVVVVVVVVGGSTVNGSQVLVELRWWESPG